MTVTIDKYLSLLPSANASQPKFVAMLTAILQPLVDTQNRLATMTDDFDIDSAVGKQLDAVGERVGLSRVLPVPITGVYFSLDTAGVGLDQGVIRGRFDPVDALASLDDETYRLIMRVKVRANNWDGSLAQAQDMLGALATTGTYLFIQDNFDMSVTIGVSGIVPSRLFVALLAQMKEWIRPSAVSLPAVIVTSVSGSPIFGIDVENNYIAGLDVGAVAVTY